MGSMWWFLDPVASRLLLRLATSHRILRKRLWNCCYLYSHLLKGSAPSFAAGNFRVKQTVASNANKALKTSWPCKVSQVLKTLNFRPGVEGGSAGIDGEQGASMGFKLSPKSPTCGARPPVHIGRSAFCENEVPTWSYLHIRYISYHSAKERKA